MTAARRNALGAELRARGLRATPTRLDVLARVRASAIALSHADLVRRLPPDHDRTTIFRALGALVRVRLLRRIDVGDHVWRFAAASDAVVPASFACRTCGRVTDLPGLTLDGIPSAPGAIRRGEIELVAFGRCDACS